MYLETVFSLALAQVLQQGVRRRKDSNPTSKGETFQMSHLSQETIHGSWSVNTLHAGMCVSVIVLASAAPAHGHRALAFFNSHTYIYRDFGATYGPNSVPIIVLCKMSFPIFTWVGKEKKVFFNF